MIVPFEFRTHTASPVRGERVNITKAVISLNGQDFKLYIFGLARSFLNILGILQLFLKPAVVVQIYSRNIL